MPDVGQWNPRVNELKTEHLNMLTDASQMLYETTLGLREDQLATLRPVLVQSNSSWESAGSSVESSTVINWIKALVVLEETISGFEFGDKSPVIVLFRILKQRRDIPPNFINWIRQHTSNRFLPYGNLLK